MATISWDFGTTAPSSNVLPDVAYSAESDKFDSSSSALGTNVAYDGEVHGLNVCDSTAYYLHSDNGRDEITDCYRSKPVYCAELNPAPKATWQHAFSS